MKPFPEPVVQVFDWVRVVWLVPVLAWAAVIAVCVWVSR